MSFLLVRGVINSEEALLEKRLQMILSPMFKHLEDIVRCQIGDDAAITSRNVHFINSHNHRGA